MKTIEMKIGNKVVSFTTKSVTIDGVEFFYGKMSDIKHSASKHVYAFKYNNEIQYLPYDPKYGQVLAAIFKQVTSLHAPKANAAEDMTQEAQSTDEPAMSSEPSSEPEEETVFDVQESSVFDTVPQHEEQVASEDEPKEEDSEVVSDVPMNTENVPENINAESSTANKSPHKKAQLKKSLIVFAAIIAVIGLLTAGYFFIFGTTDNPNAGPNANGAQKYDDIDNLINNLDNE